MPMRSLLESAEKGFSVVDSKTGEVAGEGDYPLVYLKGLFSVLKLKLKVGEGNDIEVSSEDFKRVAAALRKSKKGSKTFTYADAFAESLSEAMEVDTSEYEFSHGKKPRGFGSWAFSFDKKSADTKEMFWSQGSYADALKAAKVEAKKRGATVVYPQP